MKKTKLIFMFVAVLLTLSLLTSCGGNGEKNTTTGNGQETKSMVTDRVDTTENSSEVTSGTQDTGNDPQTQEPEDTSSVPDIRLGDDEKDWGSYNPIS